MDDEDEDDDEEEEPEEQDEEEEEELEPECDEEEEDEEEEDDEWDDVLEEDPSESESESRLASLRLFLLAFLGFLSEGFGVRGLVLAATICLSLSLASDSSFTSTPVVEAGTQARLQLSACFSLLSSPSDAGSTLGSTLGTTPASSVSFCRGGGSGESVIAEPEVWS